MKIFLIAIFIFLCGIHCFAQSKDAAGKTGAALDLSVRKPLICDQLESQTKEIPFAAVRVHIRYRIAAWLWKDGIDDTGRAESITVRAVEDLYENKAEISQFNFDTLGRNLIALLDRYAKDSAAKLREKYKLSETNPFYLLNQKNGDKLAVDASIKTLTGQTETNFGLQSLLSELQQRRSPEFFRLLNAIVQAEQTGQIKFNALTLILISDHFFQSGVPVQTQKAFAVIIINKAKTAAQTPGGDIEGFFRILGWRMPDIAKFPELLPEAGNVYNLLKTQSLIESRESYEIGERIANNPDKLSARVTEAEKTDNISLKYQLYAGAAQLALQLKKFTYAVDLTEKTREIDMSSSAISEDLRKRERDQFFGQVVEKALKENEPDAANYAVKKISGFVEKADSLGKIAGHYIERKDPIAARSTLDEAVKFAVKTENDTNGRSGILSLIDLIPAAQKIDPNYVFTLTELAAKSINAIPTLNPEDKPQTENYKNYADSAVGINWTLIPVLKALTRVNKIAAADLSNRLNKKEIKIAADFVLAIDSLEQETNLKKMPETKSPSK